MPSTLKKVTAAIAVVSSRNAASEAQLAAANATIASAASKATGAIGSGSALVTLISSHYQLISLTIGAVGVVGGMVITWVFKQRELRIKQEYAERRDRREQALHDTHMLRKHEKERPHVKN